MRTIVIILGDNDFGQTFRPLLKTINRAIKCNDDLTTPEQVTTCIKEGVRFHYLTFQHRIRHTESTCYKIEKVIDYLSKIRILFDEEAESDIQTKDHDSGAWYLELATGNVYSY